MRKCIREGAARAERIRRRYGARAHEGDHAEREETRAKGTAAGDVQGFRTTEDVANLAGAYVLVKCVQNPPGRK